VTKENAAHRAAFLLASRKPAAIAAAGALAAL
jgi:hypothetical protein